MPVQTLYPLGIMWAVFTGGALVRHIYLDAIRGIAPPRIYDRCREYHEDCRNWDALMRAGVPAKRTKIDPYPTTQAERNERLGKHKELGRLIGTRAITPEVEQYIREGRL